MPFLSVAEICNDADLAQSVVIYRTQGQFGAGGFLTSTTQIPSYGVITIADAKALQMVPEGDRITGALEFFTTHKLYSTVEAPHSSTEAPMLSDQILWRGNYYRVISLNKWEDFGYNSAILVRMTGS